MREEPEEGNAGGGAHEVVPPGPGDCVGVEDHLRRGGNVQYEYMT